VEVETTTHRWISELHSPALEKNVGESNLLGSVFVGFLSFVVGFRSVPKFIGVALCSLCQEAYQWAAKCSTSGRHISGHFHERLIVVDHKVSTILGVKGFEDYFESIFNPVAVLFSVD